jgi:beta-N-acetylhexosaminidase
VSDSHLELPTVDAPIGVLRERDLPPFVAALAAGAPALMTAHIRVPAMTGAEPATFSRTVLTDLLRGEYGFDGVVVTDALEMAGAAAAAGGIAPAAVRSLAAGADLLCIGAEVDHALVEAVAAEIATAVRDGRLPLRRVEEAASRVGRLASDFAIPAGGGPVADGRLGSATARRAVRVEGSLADLRDPLVIQFESRHSIAEGRVPWGLTPHLDGTEQISVDAAEASPAALLARAGQRPIVVVGRHLHRAPAARTLIERLAAEHPVTVVEMGWPSRWRPAGARAFVTTFGASLANGRAAAEVLGLAPPS